MASALNCYLEDLNVLIEDCKSVSDEFEEMFDNLYTSLKDIYDENKVSVISSALTKLTKASVTCSLFNIFFILLLFS